MWVSRHFKPKPSTPTVTPDTNLPGWCADRDFQIQRLRLEPGVGTGACNDFDRRCFQARAEGEGK